jgi:hypothetical protein
MSFGGLTEMVALFLSRFAATKTLWDFSGVDLLRLTKEEFIEMCGLAEGIRLYNALHYKITFYVTLTNLHVRKDPRLILSPLSRNTLGIWISFSPYSCRSTINEY